MTKKKFYFHVPVQSTATVKVEAETVEQACEMIQRNQCSIVMVKQGKELQGKWARLIPDTEEFKNGVPCD